MPRVKRKGHAVRLNTDEAVNFLVFGPNDILVPCNPFGTPAAEKKAWLRERNAILDNWSHPGQRPWGFWKHELRSGKPHDMWVELLQLLRRKLIDEDEAQALEKRHRICDANETEYLSVLFLTDAEMGTAMRELWGHPAPALDTQIRAGIAFHKWRQSLSSEPYSRQEKILDLERMLERLQELKSHATTA